MRSEKKLTVRLVLAKWAPETHLNIGLNHCRVRYFIGRNCCHTSTSTGDLYGPHIVRIVIMYLSDPTSQPLLLLEMRLPKWSI